MCVRVKLVVLSLGASPRWKTESLEGAQRSMFSFCFINLKKEYIFILVTFGVGEGAKTLL